MGPRFANFEQSFKRALEIGGTELLSAIDQLLGQKPVLYIGNTTITAYRRVHEILGSVLDFVAQTADEKQWSEVVSRLALELSRAKVIVNYQLAREQLSQDIARLLNNVLDSLEKALRDEKRKKEIRDLAERSRALIDALAVFVYRYGKKR
jgi:DNA-binding ferritin-like protein (Dps family)